MSVDQRLREAAAPDEAAARLRAEAVIGAAGLQAPSRRRRRPVAIALLCVLTGVLAVTPPGDAVARWISRLVEPDHHLPPPQASIAAIPGGGRLLAVGPGGAWVVSTDGARRRLGPYRDASFSPRGLFVAVTRGSALLAVEPGGDVRWALAREQPVHDPRWAPSGYRITYRAGDEQRVVAGDGSGDHALTPGAAPIPAAWRPGAGFQLVLARTDGSVEAWDADTERRLWRRPGAMPLALAWSANRVVIIRPRQAVVTTAGGHVLRRVPIPSGVTRAAIAPQGRAVALARGPAVGILRLSHDFRLRERLTAAAPVGDLVWSPAGHRLLVNAPRADQWVVLPVGRRGGVAAYSGIAGQFDPARRVPRGPVSVSDWCCRRR